ncbi:MAG: hypothetical protein MJ025_06930, partial [Victivallaceae bacterium]|nr:hypothetical protein [Victivallaceae bacterium]
MKSFPPAAIPIWTDVETIDQYVAFRYSFESSGFHDDAELLISSDTDFVAWVNGKEATRGQYPDPAAGPKSFNRVKVGELLGKGVNCIAV